MNSVTTAVAATTTRSSTLAENAERYDRLT